MTYTNGLADLQRLFGTNDPGATGKSPSTARTTGAQRPAAADGSTSGVGGDHAQLSSAAGLIAQALTGSDVRFEKVAALQQTVASGNYAVSSSDLADKLIEGMAK